LIGYREFWYVIRESELGSVLNGVCGGLCNSLRGGGGFNDVGKIDCWSVWLFWK
jgi:hypothetical protein